MSDLPEVTVGRGRRFLWDDVAGSVFNRHGLYVVEQIIELCVALVGKRAEICLVESFVLFELPLRIHLGEVEVAKGNWIRKTVFVVELIPFNCVVGGKVHVVANGCLDKASELTS